MISIIIPTLNEIKIIEKTLKSLRELKDIPYEIIVSDGGSKDGTIEMAKKYADKVEVYSGSKRQTIGMGRNLGASVASGDYYLFLDADMYMTDPNIVLKKIINQFDNNSNLVGLTIFLRVFPSMATLSDKIVFWIFNRIVLLLNNFIHQGASSGEFQVVRASVFKRLNGFNERLVGGEDFDMFSRLSKVGLTKSDSSLFVLHTSRRAHKVGWIKVLYAWFRNWFHATFFNGSWITEWEEVR